MNFDDWAARKRSIEEAKGIHLCDRVGCFLPAVVSFYEDPPNQVIPWRVFECKFDEPRGRELYRVGDARFNIKEEPLVNGKLL